MLVTVSQNNIDSDTLISKSVQEYCRIFGLKFEPPIIERPDGKPVIKNLPLFVSLSHSKNITVSAVSDNPVGIDIEYKSERDYIAIAERFFEVMPKDLDEFYALWTAKEAYKKAADIPLINALKADCNKNIRWLNLFEDYSLTLYGVDKDIYIFNIK